MSTGTQSRTDPRWRYNGFSYRRRRTRTVNVGDVPVGSDHPISVQSMTTPSTKDIVATVDQIERLVDAGCQIVRVTVPTTADADSLPAIRSGLLRRRVRVPLVADIHFTPAAAMRAIEHVDKIRINPGNYADKKKFNVREYTDSEYDRELQRIRDVFSPLVLRARELGVSMRVGTNHGSLSDRIMNRYGDTPEGMVESALEFVRICESLDYHELILSMKSSNPVVVSQVYRLLAARMADEQMDYPFHLGVTEAGDGEDGRIKSAIGIGALLDDGLGDTVRVSLTEDPVAEVPVAQALVAAHNRLHAAGRPALEFELRTPVVEPRDPFSYARRPSRKMRLGPHPLGGSEPVRVEVPLGASLADEIGVRRELDAEAGVRVPEETRAEVVSVVLEDPSQLDALEAMRRSIELVAPRVALSAAIDPAWLDDSIERWANAAHRLHLSFAATPTPAQRTRLDELIRLAALKGTVILFESAATGDPETAVDLALDLVGSATSIGNACIMVALTPTDDYSPLHANRLLAARLHLAELDLPILLLDRPAERRAEPLLAPATALGGLLCDGIGDAIQIRHPSPADSRRLAFGILQGARVRITKTEFISCPSCGRTLFDLEETTARIKAHTSHLKGLKIAVMGCIVNGPGEMADADFGYVGWGEDKIALFVGKEMVARDIPTPEAHLRLIELIKASGRWIDPD